MRFDSTINLGEVIAATVLLIGFITAHAQNIRKLQDIETRLNLIYQWWTRNIRVQERQDRERNRDGE